MKTPDKIKLGLECCKRISLDCFVCPYAPANNEAGTVFDCRGAMLEDLSEYIRQLEAERDAAVKDLGVVRDCKVCKNYDCRACDEPCKHCGIAQTCWEWRGLPEQKKEEEE